jgi:membrane protein YdbS with pleckstrin-like domain
MRIVTVVAVIWLLIGVAAAAQRDYFSGGRDNCAHAARVILTVVAGPLNYVGVNPKVNCNPPEPSK